jgi:hypothetical protein
MILEYPNFGKHLFDPELELQQLVSTTIKWEVVSKCIWWATEGRGYVSVFCVIQVTSWKLWSRVLTLAQSHWPLLSRCAHHLSPPGLTFAVPQQEQMHDLLLPKGRSISTVGYDFDGCDEMPWEARESLPSVELGFFSWQRWWHCKTIVWR